MVFKLLNEKEDIYNVLLTSRNAIFDKTLSDVRLLELADKFSKYALFLLLMDKKKNVGFSAFYCNDMKGRNAFLSMIVISDEYQHKGLGKVLLEKVCDESLSRGMSMLNLQVDKDNSNAIAFYKKHGFDLDKEDEKSFFFKCELKGFN